MYCKTEHLLGFERGRRRWRCCFVRRKPPPKCLFCRCFSVVFPGPSSLSYQGLEVRSPNLPQRTQGKPDFSCVSYPHLSVHLFCLSSASFSSFIIMALIAQTVHDNSLCLMSKVYIIYTIYRTLNPAYSPVSAIDKQDCYYPSTLPDHNVPH